MNEAVDDPVRDEHYVVLDPDAGEARFPCRCITCGEPCSGGYLRVRSLGHFIGVRSVKVVNRRFLVPVHAGRCRQRLLGWWWLYRFGSAAAFVAGALVFAALKAADVLDSWAFAAGVVTLLALGILVTARQAKMPFKISVWPDRSGAMCYIFYFDDERYAGEFRDVNRGLISVRHGILKRPPG
ncbi:MAG TPA: hypothetical protein VGT99_13545 [Gammaproteobacteria bacterium]|nr:hypothetical protein [Gammaproteobacteria bacterium]